MDFDTNHKMLKLHTQIILTTLKSIEKNKNFDVLILCILFITTRISEDLISNFTRIPDSLRSNLIKEIDEERTDSFKMNSSPNYRFDTLEKSVTVKNVQKRVLSGESLDPEFIKAHNRENSKNKFQISPPHEETRKRLLSKDEAIEIESNLNENDNYARLTDIPNRSIKKFPNTPSLFMIRKLDNQLDLNEDYKLNHKIDESDFESVAPYEFLWSRIFGRKTIIVKLFFLK